MLTTAQGTLPAGSTQTAVPRLAPRAASSDPSGMDLGCVWNSSLQDSLLKVKEAQGFGWKNPRSEAEDVLLQRLRMCLAETERLSQVTEPISGRPWPLTQLFP